MSDIIEQEYLDTKDAAKFCGYSVKGLEIKRVHGTGPRFFRPEGGIKIRYKKSDLITWIEGGQQ